MAKVAQVGRVVTLARLTKRLAVATLMFGALAAPGAVRVSAQSLDEVLEKHYEGMGGKDAWLGLQTMRASGTISLAGGMMQGPFSIAQKRPSMSRFNLTIQGADIIQAYDGETAWQVMPLVGIMEPTEADSATAATILESADMDGPLIGWEAAGHQVELVGAETVDGADVIHLRLTLKNGSVSEYYLDATNYRPIRMETTVGGQTSTTTVSDYREIGGLFFPFSIQVDTSLGVQALTFDKVEINPTLDESIFSMGGS